MIHYCLEKYLLNNELYKDYLAYCNIIICRTLTTNISKLGESTNFNMSTQSQNNNGLISKWLRNPSLLIFTTR